MSSKKVLIITYYWPPSGGSGVQRWLKFVKYLDREGWDTLVFTPENPSFTVQDPSLQKDVPPKTEVLRLPIWEPYKLFQRLSGVAGNKKNVAPSDFITTGKKSFFQSVSSWVRGNLFIPDPRVFWVKPSVTFLSDLIVSNNIDKIITTGPPHSIHLIGLELKKKHPSLKWVADFRDPWSEWDILDTLSLTSLARTRHKKLEYQVLKHADRVVTIAPFHVRRFTALGGRPVDLITNGFDTDDFKGIVKRRTEHFTIRHIGVVDELRDPRPFMNAVARLLAADPSFRNSVSIEFI
jgi:glycosyltransferase involved in cell wall biosynthesis